MMKRVILIMLVALAGTSAASAQEKIKDGTASSTDSQTEASAIFELESNNRGFLVPRLTTVQRDAVSNWPEGMLIYNTISNNLEFYNGTTWVRLNLTVFNSQIKKYFKIIV